MVLNQTLIWTLKYGFKLMLRLTLVLNPVLNWKPTSFIPYKYHSSLHTKSGAVFRFVLVQKIVHKITKCLESRQ